MPRDGSHVAAPCRRPGVSSTLPRGSASNHHADSDGTMRTRADVATVRVAAGHAPRRVQTPADAAPRRPATAEASADHRRRREPHPHERADVIMLRPDIGLRDMGDQCNADVTDVARPPGCSGRFGPPVGGPVPRPGGVRKAVQINAHRTDRRRAVDQIAMQPSSVRRASAVGNVQLRAQRRSAPIRPDGFFFQQRRRRRRQGMATRRWHRRVARDSRNSWRTSRTP